MERDNRSVNGSGGSLAGQPATRSRVSRRGFGIVLAAGGAGLALGTGGLRAARGQGTPSAEEAAGESDFTFEDNQGIFTGLIEFPPADANLRPFAFWPAANPGTATADEVPVQDLAHFHAEALIRSTGSLAGESGAAGYGPAGAAIPYLQVGLTLHHLASGQTAQVRLLPMLSGGDSFHYGANVALPGVASLEQAAAADARFRVVLAVDPPPVSADPGGVGRHGTFEGAPPPPEIASQRFVFTGRLVLDEAEGVYAMERVP